MHPPIDCAFDHCTGISSLTVAPGAVESFLTQALARHLTQRGRLCGVASAMAVAAACVLALVAPPWCSLQEC